MNDTNVRAKELLSRFCGRDPGSHRITEGIECSGVLKERRQIEDENEFRLELLHHPRDAREVNRIRVTGNKLSVELLPSKGLAIGEASFDGNPFFWEPPLDGLPDPLELDPDRSLLINGEPVEGIGFLEGFTGGIEMLGLLNWGMPFRNEETGRLLPLHGDVSLIPVPAVTAHIFEGGVLIEGNLEIRDPGSAEERQGPWYKRGKIVYKLSRRILIDRGTAGFYIVDSILNVSSADAKPDWGYHVQLRPEIGARFLVPSREIHPRGGEELPGDFEIWKVQEDPGPRIERGYIHRRLLRQEGLLGGSPGITSLLSYPDGRGIAVTLPPSPFVLSWFSSGGEDATEFMAPGGDGNPPRKIYSGPWNGVGPEIGASALDHDGMEDRSITARLLSPGEKLELSMKLEMLGHEESSRLRENIRQYQKER